MTCKPGELFSPKTGCKCIPICKTTDPGCGEGKVFCQEICKCECATEPPRLGCGDNRYWDKESCSCKCKTEKSCIDNDYSSFSSDTCDCECNNVKDLGPINCFKQLNKVSCQVGCIEKQPSGGCAYTKGKYFSWDPETCQCKCIEQKTTVKSRIFDMDTCSFKCTNEPKGLICSPGQNWVTDECQCKVCTTCNHA
jgi:hypothetical protein